MKEETQEERWSQRTELLLGSVAVERLRGSRVILFGVGGVGSWCAESLVRCGVGHLTIVDSDAVNVTNINRQLMATTQTVGRPKVEALRERLLSINPEADVRALQWAYTAQTADSFDLDSYDYAADAIDSLSNKALLILRATQARCGFVSSMGAALKTDATKIGVAEFWKVDGCPLARALRKKFKREKTLPRRKFACVYSPEVLENKGAADVGSANGGATVPPTGWDAQKAQINGTVAYVPAIFGLMMAGEIVRGIVNGAPDTAPDAAAATESAAATE